MIRMVAGRCPTGRATRPADQAPEEGLGDTASVPSAITSETIRASLAIAFKLQGRQTVRNIQDTVSDFYGISPRYMRDPDGNGSREIRVAHPRQIAMFFARQLTDASLPEIGRRFGGRDHSTVIHAMRAVQKRAAEYPLLEAELEVLRERLSV